MSCELLTSWGALSGASTAFTKLASPTTVFASSAAPSTQWGECCGADAPVITSISPPSANQGDVALVTILGSGFRFGSTVQVSGTGVTVSDVVIVDPSTITATFTFTASATASARAVTVTSDIGVSNSATFTVIASLATILALSPVLLLDSILGMTGDGANLLTVTDQSGNNCPVTLVNGAPTFTATKWGGTLPAIQFIAAQNIRLQAVMPANVLQPCTVFAVIDQYIAATTFNNIFNAGSFAAYAQTDTWKLIDGLVLTTSITQSGSSGKYIRFDICNGASSKVYRSGGAVNAGNAGAAGILATFGIGGPIALSASQQGSFILAAMAVFQGELTPAQMATILAFYTTRYPGINQT